MVQPHVGMYLPPSRERKIMGSKAISSKRSLTPSISTSSSSEVSTQQSSSSHDDSRVDNIAPAGRFDLGLNKAAQANHAPAGNAASADPASAAALTDDATTRQAQSANSAHPVHPVQSSHPPIPQPVRTLIRSLACVLVSGGLFSTIYGGLKLMTPVDQGLDPQREANVGVMVSGVVEMVIGLVVGMVTLNPAHLAASPSDPA